MEDHDSGGSKGRGCHLIPFSFIRRSLRFTLYSSSLGLAHSHTDVDKYVDMYWFMWTAPSQKACVSDSCKVRCRGGSEWR